MLINSVRNGCLLLILLLVFFCNPVTAELKPINSVLHNYLTERGFSAIPLKQDSSHYLYVEASFGNNVLYPLLLDTGCGHTSFGPETLRLFDFKKTGKSRVGIGGGGYGGLEPEVLIPSLILGQFVTNDETVFILNHPLTHLSLHRKPALGLLGIDFLRKHSAIIDFSDMRLYLKNFSNEQTPLNFLTQQFAYKTSHLERSPNGLPIIEAKINQSKPLEFLLDSGSIILLSSQHIKALGLPLIGPIDQSRGTDGGEMKFFKTIIEKISVGSVDSFPKHVIATNMQYIQKGVGRPLAGVIGIDWLREHQVILDANSDVVFLK